MEYTPLQGERKTAHPRDVQLAWQVAQLGRCGEQVIFGADQFGRPPKRFARVAPECLAQSRKRKMPNPVPRVMQFRIRLIFAEAERLIGHVSVDLRAPDAEKRTCDGELDATHGARGKHWHPAEAARAGAPQQLQEEGLHLIVRMMREEEARAVARRPHLGKKCVAQLAGRRLKRELRLHRDGAGIDCIRDKIQAQRAGEVRRESRIVRAGGAQSMVEVTDDQPSEPGMRQPMQKRHGIPSAAHPDEVRILR